MDPKTAYKMASAVVRTKMDARREFAAAAEALQTSGGAEEARTEQSQVLVSFDPAAGIALSRFDMKPYVIAQTPTDARHLIQLGVAPDHLIGLLWAGLEEGDYLQASPKIANFISGDPADLDWKPQVFGLIQQHLGSTMKITPIFTADSLSPALRGLGVAEPLIQQIFQASAEAAATLEQMK